MAISTIRQWQYYVNSAKLAVGDRLYKIPQERFKSFEITEDYEGYIFPLFKMTVVLEPSRYYMVLENKDSCYFILDIRKRYTNPGSNETHRDDPFIQGKFEAVIDDNVADTQYMDKLYANNKNYRRMIDKDLNDLQATSNVVDFYLFRQKILDAFKKKNINVLFKEAKVADAIGYLFRKTEITDMDILFAPPDNTRSFEFFLIPPSTILKAFNYIDAYYGIYKSGSLIFFGLNTCYIVPYSSRCDVFAANEPRVIEITVPGSSIRDIQYATALGEYWEPDAGSCRTFTCDQKMISIFDDKKANSYIGGYNARTFEPIEGKYNVTYGAGDLQDERGGANYVRILENLTENEYIGSMFTARSSANAITMAVPFQDIDATAFTPNKRYKLTFNDSRMAYLIKYSKQSKIRNKYGENSDYFMMTKIVHRFLNTGGSFLLNSVGYFKYPRG